VLSSFGPWGAAAISVRSQLAQLQDVLNGENLLSSGQLKLDPPRAATFKHIVSSNKRVASILKSLYDLDALQRLAPMFGSVTDSPFTRHQDATAQLAALGLTQWGYPMESPTSPSPPVAIGISVDTGAYNRLIGPFWITRAGLIGCDSGCPGSPDLEIGGTPLSLSGTFVTAGRNGDAVSFDVAPIFDPKSRGRETKMQPAQTVTLNAREGRNRALLMIVRHRRSIDDPPAQFESWILVRSAPLTAK
jgi:hypothetical protein